MTTEPTTEQWTADEALAACVAFLIETAEEEGVELTFGDELPQAA